MSNTLGFGLRFALLFALLTTAFEVSRGSAFEQFVVEDLILTPAVHAINFVTPAARITIADRTLTSAQGSRLHITRGCEGIEMFLLLISAIASFPAAIGHRMRGFLLGSALAYLLSIGRLMALYYVLQYWPTAWEGAHGLILPLAPIILMALFFLWWSRSDPTFAPLSRDTHAA
jgi:exosortase family protein XrtM